MRTFFTSFFCLLVFLFFISFSFWVCLTVWKGKRKYFCFSLTVVVRGKREHVDRFSWALTHVMGEWLEGLDSGEGRCPAAAGVVGRRVMIKAWHRSMSVCALSCPRQSACNVLCTTLMFSWHTNCCCSFFGWSVGLLLATVRVESGGTVNFSAVHGYFVITLKKKVHLCIFSFFFLFSFFFCLFYVWQGKSLWIYVSW